MVPVATLLGAQHYKASTGFSSLTNHASLASHNEQKKKSLIIINVCIDRRTEWKTGIRAKFVILLKYRNYYYYYYYDSSYCFLVKSQVTGSWFLIPVTSVIGVIGS